MGERRVEMNRKGLVGSQIMLIIYIVIFIICLALAYIILNKIGVPIVDTLKRQWGWVSTVVKTVSFIGNAIDTVMNIAGKIWGFLTGG